MSLFGQLASLWTCVDCYISIVDSEDVSYTRFYLYIAP
jgi:hypothetical protein